MATGYELIVRKNNLPHIISGLRTAVELGLDKFAADVIQDSIARTPTDTGGLRASAFRITKVYNNFGAAVGAMKARNPKAEAIDEPSREEGTAIMGYAATYARPVNDGHHTASGSFVPAQPFLTPVFMAKKGDVVPYIQKYIERLARGGGAE